MSDRFELRAGDCRAVMRAMDPASVDGIVTDPPYGLEFMGLGWDKFAPDSPTLRNGWDHASHATSLPEPVEDRKSRHESFPAYHRRRRTYHCRGCGKRDGFRNEHPCGDQWEAEWVDAKPLEALAFQVWSTEWATEAYRVLKPGAHVLAFGGPRTFHRLTCALEDAGFEIREVLCWLYGQGFPKSMDLSKAIDKRRDDRAEVLELTAWIAARRDAAGVTNEAIDAAFGFHGMAGHWTSQKSQPIVPTTEQIPQLLEILRIPWEDVPEGIRTLWERLNQRKGTPGEAWQAREVTGQHDGIPPAQTWRAQMGDERAAVRPPSERRDEPHSDEARAWVGWGTSLKPGWEPIVLARKPPTGTTLENVLQTGLGALNVDGCRIESDGGSPSIQPRETAARTDWDNRGDGDGIFNSRTNPERYREQRLGETIGRWPTNVALDPDAASVLDRAMPMESPSRFFYCPKPTTEERMAGVPRGARPHPTVKPVALMRWLCRMIVPPGSLILDPFTGSGSTGVAALEEGMRFVGVELDENYRALAVGRLEFAAAQEVLPFMRPEPPPVFDPAQTTIPW